MPEYFCSKKIGNPVGMRLLDVGCWPDNLTALIAELVGDTGSVVGVDPSRERIAIAVAQKQIKKPNLSFYEWQAEDLSLFPSASIDVVFVNSTFHRVEDQPLAVKELTCRTEARRRRRPPRHFGWVGRLCRCTPKDQGRCDVKGAFPTLSKKEAGQIHQAAWARKPPRQCWLFQGRDCHQHNHQVNQEIRSYARLVR